MLWKHLILFSLCTVCCVAKQSNSNSQQVVRMSQEEAEEDSIGLDDGPRYYRDRQEKKTSDVIFSLAKHFQDNMVLQRAPKKAKIYGFSPYIGAKVMAQLTVTSEIQYYFGTNVIQGPAPGVGSWVITLDPMNITTPVTIKFLSEAGALTLHNVLFGDVWVCSGQSNMQFSVPQMLNGDEEAIDAQNYPNIRLFTVSMAQSSTPLYDLSGVEEKWSIPSDVTLSHGAWQYFSSVCWLYGKHIHQTLGYPIGLVASDWGGTPVEAWSSPDALSKCHVDEEQTQPSNYMSVDTVGGPQNNSCLWNAMIHPLLGMTIYGAIWYQGEDDSSLPERMNRYNCTFPAMIDDWRSKFNQASQGQTSSSFPFGFVQLSANKPDPSITVGFPDIRWHQTADYGYVPNSRMPNTFMAVAMDLPDFKSTYGSIHPRDKEDVGYRLALSGLNVAYNKMEMSQGPFPVKGQLAPPNTLILDYGHGWVLNIKNADGFELSCKPPSPGEPLDWRSAPIIAHNTTSVSLHSNICTHGSLYAIRYAWRESPCGFKACAVYSTLNDLPAPPVIGYFRGTEDGNQVLKFES